MHGSRELNRFLSFDLRDLRSIEGNFEIISSLVFRTEFHSASVSSGMK